MSTLILILTISLRCLAPAAECFTLIAPEAIRPYEKIWLAVIAIESGGQQFAVGDKHLKEYSYGIAQLRRVRIEDYNRRTGSSYTIIDAFDPKISKRIFYYYADLIGPCNQDKIIRSWNGSGKKTYIYLAKVRKQLLSL